MQTHKRKQLFKSTTNLPLPPKTVIIRWGTWLNTPFCHANNFSKICVFIGMLERNKSKAIEKLQLIVKDKVLQSKLIGILEYGFLSKAIDQIEMQGLSIDRQMKILKEVKDQLKGNA